MDVGERDDGLSPAPGRIAGVGFRVGILMDVGGREDD
jgi:hypothetical protein